MRTKQSMPSKPDIIQNIQTVLGGGERVAAVRTIYQKTATTTIDDTGRRISYWEAWFMYPDKLRFVEQVDLGRDELVVTPEFGVQRSAKGEEHLPTAIRQSILLAFERDLLFLAQRLNSPEMKITIEESATLSSQRVSTLRLVLGEVMNAWQVDLDSGRVQSVSYDSPQGRKSVGYSHWARAGELVLPFRKRVEQDGKLVSEENNFEIKINPANPGSWFKSP